MKNIVMAVTLSLTALVTTACSSSSDGWVKSDYGDAYARSMRIGDTVTSELRSTIDNRLLAEMVVSPDSSTWSDQDGVRSDLVVRADRPDPEKLIAAPTSETAVDELPQTEDEANDLLFRLASLPIEPSAEVAYGCEVHDWDNMICVVCRDNGNYCYTCAWDDVKWYGQCTSY